jgi:multidrug resistance protein
MSDLRRISVLMATAFVDMVGFAIVFPLLPFYAERLHAEAWMIGWMIAAFSIMQLIFAPIWGRFSDRYGRRPAILLGLSISAVAFTIFAYANSIWLLFLTRLVQGIAGATVGVAQAYVSDSSKRRDRAKALGWLSAATSAGVMVGPGIGSLAFGWGPSMPGLVAAGLCVINVMFAFRWLPESNQPKTTEEWRKEQADTTRRSVRGFALDILLRPRGSVARLIWIYAVGMLGFMSMTAIIPLYLGDAFGVSESNIGLFFMFIGFLSIVMRAIVLGRMVDRWGETRVMRIGAGFLTAGLLTIPLPANVVVAGLAMGLVPIGTALLFPTVSAQISHRTPRREMGQTLGVQQFFGGGSRVLAPIWSTAVYGAVGWKQPFFIAGLVVMFVAFLTFGVKQQPAPATTSTEVA